MKNEFDSQIRKGLIEYSVLLVISKGKVYASDIINALYNANLITTEGTIYPLLSRLKDNKFCEYVWEESKDGPPRKYYILSNLGKKYLVEQTKVWEEIIKSINFLQK